MELTPTWDLLREAWFKDKVFAGPSEKFDAEQEWDRFVKEWETDRSDLKTLQETYRNFGAKCETLRAEVERLRDVCNVWGSNCAYWVKRTQEAERERDAALAAHPEPDAACPERIDDGMRDYACAKAAGHADDCGAPTPPALTVTPDHAEMAMLHALSAFGLDSDDPIDPVGFAKVYVATLTRGATIVASEDGPPLTYGRHPFVARVQAGINDPDNLADADQEHDWLIEAIEIIDRLSSDRDADAQAYFRGYGEELATEIEGLSTFPLIGRSAQAGYRIALRRAASVVRRSGAEKP